jgi:hypothetical protein
MQRMEHRIKGHSSARQKQGGTAPEWEFAKGSRKDR